MVKILLVDDEPVIRMAFQGLLDWESAGYEIVGAVGNGVEALSFLKDHTVDVVITDLKMPQMDGLQLIQKLKETSFPGSILVLSNYSDFNLVREALLSGAQDYMLKVKMNDENILYSLKQLTAKLRPENGTSPAEIHPPKPDQANRLGTLAVLLKDPHSLDDLSEEQQQELLPESNYRMLYLQIERKENGKNVTEKSFRSILQMVFNDQRICDLIRFSRHGYVALFPWEHAGITDEMILSKANQLVRQIQLYLNHGCKVINGGELSTIYELRERFKLCETCYELSFYEDFPSVSSIEDFVFGTLSPDITPESESAYLTECYWTGGMAGVNSRIEAILTACAKQHVCPSTVRDFAYNVIQVLLRTNPFPANNKVFAMHVRILHCATRYELLTQMSDLLSELLQNTTDTTFQQYRKEIRAVLLYLQYHFAENLSLDDIAEEANLDRSYLSRLFKKETGQNIFQYLNDLRMKKAAELILKEHTYIHEVAAAVGISDQYYFARLFKKYYGVSPTEYRNSAETM